MPKGDVLRGYTLVQKIGQGTYGSVYTCLTEDHSAAGAGKGEPLVMKMVDVSCLEEKDRDSCLTEVRVLAKLALVGCEYIVAYKASFIEDSCLCMVMEFAEGGTLQQLIRRSSGGLSHSELWSIFAQLCCALYTVHEAGVLHRDLKTANVFLTKKLEARLGDFGLARVLSNPASLARSVVGTPYYLSPEMCNGEEYSSKSDVWALGVVFYEMCTAAFPFKAANQAALVLQIVRSKVNRSKLDTIQAKHGAFASQVITRCLRKSPGARPSVAQLLSERQLICEAHRWQVSVPRSCLPKQGPSRAARGDPATTATSSSAATLTQSEVYREEVCKAIRAHPVAGSVSLQQQQHTGGGEAVRSPPAAPSPRVAAAAAAAAAPAPAAPAAAPGVLGGAAVPLRLQHQAGLIPCRRVRRGAPAKAAGGSPEGGVAPPSRAPPRPLPRLARVGALRGVGVPGGGGAVVASHYRSRQARQRDIRMVQCLPEFPSDDDDDARGGGGGGGGGIASLPRAAAAGSPAASSHASEPSASPMSSGSHSVATPVASPHGMQPARPVSGEVSEAEEEASPAVTEIPTVMWSVKGEEGDEMSGAARASFAVSYDAGEVEERIECGGSDGSDSEAVEEVAGGGGGAAASLSGESSGDGAYSDEGFSTDTRRADLEDQVAAVSTELAVVGCDAEMYSRISAMLGSSRLPNEVYDVGAMDPDSIRVMRLVYRKLLLVGELEGLQDALPQTPQK